MPDSPKPIMRVTKDFFGLKSLPLCSRPNRSPGLISGRICSNNFAALFLTVWNLDKVSQQLWYLETGSGMGATLNIAINKHAYTLSDRGTWIRFGNKSDFEILFEGGEELFNPYGLILVNPKKHPHVNVVDGQALIDWLIGEEGQQRINSYRVDGKHLFFANAK